MSLPAKKATPNSQANGRYAKSGRKESVAKEVRVGRTVVGKGVFSRRRYPEGAVIGEIAGEIIEDPSYGSDYCLYLGGDRHLEPDAPFRYLNHSCEPNCEFDWLDAEGDDDSAVRQRVFVIALHNIEQGDELTIDYNWSADVAIPCHCQSPSCRGWIVSAEEVGLINSRPSRSPLEP